MRPNSCLATLVSRHDPARTRGFTLVELLVGLGIIALVLALLIPALNAARASSRTTACASNARQIGAAALGRAIDAEGYLPLAGHVRVEGDAQNGSLPSQLNDSRRVRYAYVQQTGFWETWPERPLSFPTALLLYMDPAVREITDGELSNEGELPARFASLGVFHCPDAPDEPSPTSLMAFRHGGAETPITYFNRYDFAYNSAVVGYDHRFPASASPARGQLTSVRDASRVALMAEIDRFSQPTNVSTLAAFTPIQDEVTAPVTLRDVLERTGRARFGFDLDSRRHRARVNALFVDGHVETVRHEAGALENVALRNP